MIYTGSIGLHHVLDFLKNDGFGNKATKNDMFQIGVEVLAEEDALALANELIKGESIQCENSEALAQEIVSLADSFAHYIHCIVKSLKLLDREIELADVHQEVDKKLRAGGHEWDLDHYVERLQEYYGDDEDMCIAVLESLAHGNDGLDIEEIANEVSKKGNFGGKKKIKLRLRKVMKKMMMDHYFEKSEDGRYSFLFGIVKRWCVLNLD